MSDVADHPNVVKMLGACSKGGKTNLTMTIMTLLATYVRTKCIL